METIATYLACFVCWLIGICTGLLAVVFKVKWGKVDPPDLGPVPAPPRPLTPEEQAASDAEFELFMQEITEAGRILKALRSEPPTCDHDWIQSREYTLEFPNRYIEVCVACGNRRLGRVRKEYDPLALNWLSGDPIGKASGITVEGDSLCFDITELAGPGLDQPRDPPPSDTAVVC